MRARLLVVAAPVGLSVLVAGVYFAEYRTLNPFDAPPNLPYQGCVFHATRTVESLEAATRFEHNASAYAHMPVQKVGRAMNGMAMYALPLGPGAYPCSAAPMDIYLEVSTGRLELYRRCCGP
jgi:hypothetical protein